jgi:Tol biopolymer transport system component
MARRRSRRPAVLTLAGGVVVGGRAVTAAVALTVAAAWVSSTPTASATFPGRNGLIAYSGWGSHCEGANIFSTTIAGRSRHALTDYGCGSTSAIWPTWSPDGRRILHVKYVDSPGTWPEPRSEVVVMRPDGSRKRVVARERVHRIEWGPDGRTLAWVMRGDRPSVYVGPFENPRERLIAVGSAPTWSPDGKSLALVEPGGRHESCSQLSIFDVATGGRTRVVVDSVEETDSGCTNTAGTPDWSPDGRRFAYNGSGARSSGDARHLEIFVIGRNGNHARQLTHDGAADTGPRWSPDGRWISYNHIDFRDRTRNGLYVMRADGSRKRRLVRYGGDASWQPLPKPGG